MSRYTAKDRQGLAILGAVGIAFAGLLVFFLVATDKEALDDRLCPNPVMRKTAFLIDRSDDTPTQTTDEIRKRIIKIIDNDVQQGELVSIFYITDQIQSDLKPVFESCKPQSEGNELYESTRSIEKKFAELFRKPLEMALAKQPSGSGSSPIAETLTDFTASDYLDGQHNRLVVFSDLMQNSDALSLYNCSSKTTSIEQYRQRRAGAIERPELRNVEVSLNIIPREGIGSSTIKCRDGFWVWFFGNNAGENAELTTRYLPGGATIK